MIRLKITGPQENEASLSGQLSLNEHKGERAFQVRGMAWTKGMKGGQCQACLEDLEWKEQVKGQHTPCPTCSSMKFDSEAHQSRTRN